MNDKISTGLESAFSGEEGELQTVIIRHAGDMPQIAKSLGFFAADLLNGFAAARISEAAIRQLAQLPEILYIDITRQMAYEQAVSPEDRLSACFPVRTPGNTVLDGTGVFIGIVDSGADLLHPAFIRDDGSSRFVNYWDQTQEGNPPVLYGFGSEYNAEQIQKLILQGRNGRSLDPGGHGTAVCGIAAALAPGADFVGTAVLPDTAAVLCAADYIVRCAAANQKPLILNMSYGNNYGDHFGNSMIEDYLNLLPAVGKIAVVCGMGNEGTTGRHRRIQGSGVQRVKIRAGQGLKTWNLQLWSESVYRFRLYAPQGDAGTEINSGQTGTAYRFTLSNTDVEIQVGQPTPYNGKQEIFLVFRGDDAASGVWELRFSSVLSREYAVDAWLPVAASTSGDVAFEVPTEELTLTIPASAEHVISVGAYDSRLQTAAVFTGRGGEHLAKPDLAAPGVGILTANSGGGYVRKTGTSFAVPFVSAACANLMQWGIVDGNDPFLYGERLKAELKNGAKQLPGTRRGNPETGAGVLCAANSLPLPETGLITENSL